MACRSGPADARGCGAAGSAPHWQCGGQGFESPQLHPSRLTKAPDSGAFSHFGMCLRERSRLFVARLSPERSDTSRERLARIDMNWTRNRHPGRRRGRDCPRAGSNATGRSAARSARRPSHRSCPTSGPHCAEPTTSAPAAHTRTTSTDPQRADPTRATGARSAHTTQSHRRTPSPRHAQPPSPEQPRDPRPDTGTSCGRAPSNRDR
jgi:hypothetical protein